jgi:hypothetical protein
MTRRERKRGKLVGEENRRGEVTESLIERGRKRKSDINERGQAWKTKMEREGVIGIK